MNTDQVLRERFPELVGSQHLMVKEIQFTQQGIIDDGKVLGMAMGCFV